MKNKIGLSIHPEWVCGDWGRLEQELERICEAGADSCELVLHGLDVIVGGEILPDRLKTLKNILEKYPLLRTLHVPYELDLMDEKAGVLYRKVLTESVKLAQQLECAVIVYHASNARASDYSEEQEAEIVRDIVRQAEGVILCMENGPFYPEGSLSPGRSAEAMGGFCRKVDHPAFALTFDAGHSFLNHLGQDSLLLEDLKTVLPYIGHIHLHDNFGYPAPDPYMTYSHNITCGFGDIHLPLGWGRLPVGRVLKMLEEGGYKGILNLEIEKRFEGYYEKCIEMCR